MRAGNKIKVQWVGDIALTAGLMQPGNHPMLERSVNLLNTHIEPADLRIGNWEAPLTGEEGVTPRKKIALRTDEATAEKVSALGLDAALLANNHALDCMLSGLERTISFLNKAGTATVGAGMSERESRAPLLLDVRGVRTACLSYVDADTHPGVPEECGKHLNPLEPDRVLDEVGHWSAGGYVVLACFHWGSDFVPLPSPKQRAFARRVIDAGAAVVVCYHPHRLLPFERYGDGYIFYGSGNLLAGNIYPWPRFTEPTAVVTCDLEDGRVTAVRIQYFIVRDGIVSSDDSGRGARAHRKLNAKIGRPEGQYARAWSRALAYDLGVVRPLHFLRRNKNPLKLLASLERRHATEYLGLMKSMLRGKPNDGRPLS